ncbi:TPA: AAA family ATPase [Klebsiella quasipneumoniae]
MTLNKKSAPSLNIGKTTHLPPAEGERRAIRGYMGQYEKAGAAIYAELEYGQLKWIGVADRSAGIADDLVLGFDGVVIGHQFKTSRFPSSFTLTTLLTGSAGLLKPLVYAWEKLCNTHPDSRVEIRLVVNDYPSVKDTIGSEEPAHSAAFLYEFGRFPDRSLQEWRSGNWHNFIEKLMQHSGLNDNNFEMFIHALRVIYGSAADFVQSYKLSAEQARLASEIAQLLPRLVSDSRDKDRWSRDEILHELGWKDPIKTRHIHQFPIGAHVQRNRDTELQLLQTLRNTVNGYIALIGPPGSGKSTLLQLALAAEPNVRVVRYLAFVPGAAQGVGRGEADDFLDDISAQLRKSGLLGIRLRNNNQFERREQFGELLKQAGERYISNAVRTVIIVDGLDHIPREELPVRSLLSELPLPSAIPEGVTFVLGTQHLELNHLKPAVQEQAAASGRFVTMRPLGRVAVARMADTLGLSSTISRVKLYELSRGHPLAANYLVQALLVSDADAISNILAGGMKFDGDIESVYTSAWREIVNAPDVMHVLGFLARIEAPMPLRLLATIIDVQSIERTLKTVQHLLKETPHGWTVFHNSFRLYVLSKPKITLGSIDETYSQNIYRKLAHLSRHAPDHSLQSWLELRYLARAGDQEELLTLATPKYFRQQFAHGRSLADIDADIRLAMIAARSSFDGVVITRLLLCSDEMSRRAAALEHADELPRAMLKAGYVDAAFSFVQDFPNAGYEVVDALLELNEFDRAKELFEELEPLSQLHSSRFENYGHSHNLNEFKKWARRVFHFRDYEQIKQAIDFISVEGMTKSPEYLAEGNIDSINTQLRLEVARAIVCWQADVDIQDICDKLEIKEEEHLGLTIQAGFSARDRGDKKLALDLFSKAIKSPGFDNIHNGWRRSIALFSASSNFFEIASRLFDTLFMPQIKMADKEMESVKALVTAIIEHVQLATILGKKLPEATLSEHIIFRPLQSHATEAGHLLGMAMKETDSITSGSVQRACRMLMKYILKLNSHSGSDHYQAQVALQGTLPIIKTLIQTAALCGLKEYSSVKKEIDIVFPVLALKGNFLLRHELAIAMYQADGDRESAAARLEPMINELIENTPSEQLEALAYLANSFTAIGEIERARSLLSSAHDHCFGYALAARKDPLYSIWRNILVLANATDPDQRDQRIRQLMRQVDGMKETEGANAAYRLTEVLINESMYINSHSGYQIAQTLTNWGMIPWPNQVNELMIGILRGRPELLLTCISIWCNLCLPFYMEPHYRDPSHVGDFIDIAVDTSELTLLVEVVFILLDAIEVRSRAHERLTLLKRLHAAASRHSFENIQRIDNAISRWSFEEPPARHSYTPQKYDDASTLDELQLAFETDGKKLDYNASSRFRELAHSASLDQVMHVYESWDCLKSDARCRFFIAERLVKDGKTELARKLVQEYDASNERENYWSPWMGGRQLDFYRIRKLLDGDKIYREAYENLIDSIVAGKENTMSLLMDIDSILPVICQNPDWPAVWSILAEQMSSTREYNLGTPFEFKEEVMTDESLLSELLYFALRLPVSEVRRHARHCALEQADLKPAGQNVFKSTMIKLLTGILDEPHQALQILLMLEHNIFAFRLHDYVASLANHRDVAVAEAACLLAQRWLIPVSRDFHPLPLTYQLTLGGDLNHDNLLSDSATGAMFIETDLGWTQMLRPVAKVLASLADCDETNIRQRAATFIQKWGGLKVFGQESIKTVESQLRILSMKITYQKPHAYIGILALRHVAGELRRAGLLSKRDLPTLLEQLDAPLPPAPPVKICVRPKGIKRPLKVPNVSWNESEEAWVKLVSEDTKPWAEQVDEFVIAEISQFKIHDARRADYQVYRFRSPQLSAHTEEFWKWYGSLPAAVWLGEIVPLDEEIATTIVRRIVSSIGTMSLQDFPITLCPNLQSFLGWQNCNEDPNVYLDKNSLAVARLVHWRDAGPVDIDDDSIWGEGCYLSITKAGLAQIQNVLGELIVHSFASREVQKLFEGAEKMKKTAVDYYSIH